MSEEVITKKRTFFLFFLPPWKTVRCVENRQDRDLRVTHERWGITSKTDFRSYGKLTLSPPLHDDTAEKIRKYRADFTVRLCWNSFYFWRLTNILVKTDRSRRNSRHNRNKISGTVCIIYQTILRVFFRRRNGHKLSGNFLFSWTTHRVLFELI